jgi:RNA polymerase sigma-70 factor (ECF subfamily)
VSVDDLVLARAQKGDSGALDAVLRHHYDAIRSVCHRIVMNTADAEDATQMALISVARALPSFDRRSSLSTWIYRIATNAALDELRRISRRPIPTQDSAMERTQPDATGEIDTSLLITEALGLVGTEQRVVLVLRHIADLDYEEIASILDIPVGTVRSRLARGRAQLSEIVGNQLTEPTRHNSADDTLAPKDGRP